MKTRNDCREWRELLGAYALGHLEGDERAGLEAHLEGCAQLPRGAGRAGSRWRGCSPTPTRRGSSRRRSRRRSWGGGSRRRSRRERQRARAAPAAAPVRRLRAWAARRRPRRRRCWSLFVLGGGGSGGPSSTVGFAALPAGDQHRRDAGAARLRHRDPHVRARGPLGDALPGLAAGAGRRLLSGRDLPLPLGRRLRRGAQLGARPLADAGGRASTPASEPSSRRWTRRSRT